MRDRKRQDARVLRRRLPPGLAAVLGDAHAVVERADVHAITVARIDRQTARAAVLQRQRGLAGRVERDRRERVAGGRINACAGHSFA